MLSRRVRWRGVGAPVLPIPKANAANTGGSLDEKREEARIAALNSFKFENTNLAKWNGKKTACLSGNVFTVDSPEDFAYALANANGTLATPQTINILCDLDMNGAVQKFSENRDWTNVTIQGNNHTIYNLHVENGSHAGLCQAAVKRI